MHILGVTDGDDSGAVLLNNGRIIAAINEERLSRKKLVIGFPYESVREVLRITDTPPEAVDLVAIAALGENFHPRLVANRGWFDPEQSASRKLQYGASTSLARLVGRYSLPRATYRRLKLFMQRKRQEGVRRIIADELGIKAPAEFYPHHLCHGLSAFGASGFEEAVVITLDGGGDGSCSNVLKIANGRTVLLNSIDSYHSIGNYYSYATHISGFTAGIHEGKITGRAAYGEPEYADVFRNLIAYKDGQIVNRGNVYFHSAVRRILDMLPRDFDPENLAASIQQVLEEVCVEYCRHWIRKSGLRRVAVAGGVFSNVKLNQRVGEIDGVESLFVFPHMGDGGLAAGAAYAAHLSNAQNNGGSSRIPKLEDVYQGPEFSNSDIERALVADGSAYKQLPDIERAVAELLVEGHVVARFNGRMEYGPRALGNRSILYQPTDPTVNQWLNCKLKRTEFMPFAPAVQMEYAGQCFAGINGNSHMASFMTVTFDCTEWMHRNCPAVVHLDNTARPQLVRRETNPSFYRLIDVYREITGLPCIVNTSFNMHEEPIVCSPDDALRAFRLGNLDYLAIGSFLVKNPRPVDRVLVPSPRVQAPGRKRSTVA